MASHWSYCRLKHLRHLDTKCASLYVLQGHTIASFSNMRHFVLIVNVSYYFGEGTGGCRIKSHTILCGALFWVPNATLKTMKIEDDFPILPSSNSSQAGRRNLDLLAARLSDELWRSFGNWMSFFSDSQWIGRGMMSPAVHCEKIIGTRWIIWGAN